jgi:putative copper resistance protein D
MMQVMAEWVELISITLCLGVLVCHLWVIIPLHGDKDPYAASLRSMWRLFGIGIVALTAGSIVELFMRSTEISGWSLSGVLSVLPTVLFRTHYGGVWLVRIAALVLLSVALLGARRRRDTKTFLCVSLVIGLIIAATRSASGHASDAGDFSIPEIMDWLHLVAASVWGGGLMVLFAAILPKLKGPEEKIAPVVAGVAGRFSTMVGIAVGFIALTAIYNLWIEVRSIEALVKTPYGLAVTAKIVLFVIVINFGALNRYVTVPLLQEWGGGSPVHRGMIGRIASAFFSPFLRNLSGRRVAAKFRVLVGIEALVIVGILFCASLLRHEVPARHYMHMHHMHNKGSVAAPPGGVHMHHE